MAKFKTVHADGKVITAEGKIRLASAGSGLVKSVTLMLLNGKTNRNDWRYENLEAHRALFADTPILISYKGGNLGAGHEFDEVHNLDGTVSQSFMSATAERIVGRLGDESKIRIEDINGESWIVGDGILWAFYAPELAAELSKQGAEFDVSIETLIDEYHIEGTTEVFTKYQILGTTILGKGVSPAVKDANIRALSAIGAEAMKQLTLRVASEREQAKPQENNPQTKTNERTKIAMTITDIAGLFPAHTALAVNANKVALLSANGTPCLCEISKDGDKLVAGEITELKVNASFGEGFDVSVDGIAGQLLARCNQLSDDLKTANEEKDAALKTLSDMQKAENERRHEAVKNAIKARLAEINASRENKIPDNACDELLTDAKVDAYCAMEAEGKFCGIEAACKDVDAICMNAIIASDTAKLNSAKKHYAWEQGASEEGATDSISALISRNNGTK